MAELQRENGFATIGAASELATKSFLSFNDDASVRNSDGWKQMEGGGIHTPDALASGVMSFVVIVLVIWENKGCGAPEQGCCFVAM